MNENKRYEDMLKKWGECNREINYLQTRVNNLKKDFEKSQSKDYIQKEYDVVLGDMLKQMRTKLEKYEAIETLLNDMFETEVKVIKLRYIDKKKWEAIAILTFLSRTHCFNIKNKLIKKLKERDNDECKANR